VTFSAEQRAKAV